MQNSKCKRRKGEAMAIDADAPPMRCAKISPSAMMMATRRDRILMPSGMLTSYPRSMMAIPHVLSPRTAASAACRRRRRSTQRSPIAPASSHSLPSILSPLFSILYLPSPLPPCSASGTAPTRRSFSACGRTGMITSRHSRTPFGEPGRLTISVRAAMPQTARESMA